MFLHEVTDGDEDVLVEQSLPEYPGTHEQTPLLLHVPLPEQFLGQPLMQLVPERMKPDMQRQTPSEQELLGGQTLPLQLVFDVVTVGVGVDVPILDEQSLPE